LDPSQGDGRDHLAELIIGDLTRHRVMMRPRCLRR